MTLIRSAGPETKKSPWRPCVKVSKNWLVDCSRDQRCRPHPQHASSGSTPQRDHNKLIIYDAQLPGVPRKGPLAFQLHPERKDGEWGASLVQFRNIRIKELSAAK